MRFKIQEFTYNEETGVSTMLAVCKYGELRSEVKCHESDKDVQNQWDGYRFCEYKITLQFMKCRVAELAARADGAQDAAYTVYNNMERNGQLTQCAYETLLAIERQADGYYKEWVKARDRYNELKDHYKEWCDGWLNDRRALRNKYATAEEE